MKLGFISLGCPKNLVDTEIMIARARSCGYRIVNDKSKADIIIVNTCAFLDSAREEAIDTLIECGELKRTGRLQYLLAVGCLPQVCGEELIAEMPELDGASGIGAHQNIESLLKEVIDGHRPCIVNEANSTGLHYAPRFLSTAPGMAYLKIADGCNNCCSYCLIPSIRGRYRSKTAPEIMLEVRQLAASGVKELVLIAQDSGLYGSDLGWKDGLAELLPDICQVDGLEWIRIMYLHPDHISERLLETVASQEKIVPYLEVPVQHASSKVLKAMNRNYSQDYLITAFQQMREAIPGLTIRTTLMLGFPGETEQDYNVLKEFVKSVEFDWLGSFVYEPQEGTRAATYGEDLVPAEIAASRQSEIMQIQQGITRKKNLARIGSTERILVQKRHSAQLFSGRGGWQAPEVDGITMIKSETRLERGQMVEVTLKAIRRYDMIGEYVQ